LSLLEDQIKNLGSKNAAEEASPDFPPERDNDDSLQGSRTMRSWLARHSPGDGVIERQREVESDEIAMSKGSVSPKATSSTLEGQFGRLVVDRNSGTSRYVNHQVLTELADQVYFILSYNRH
jgi:hypothetical protein